MDGEQGEQPVGRGKPIKLFVSYSWSDKLRRKLLVKKLKSAGYVALCDEDFIEVGDQLNKQILQAMDGAHGLVALLTQEALQSAAVQEELTRAHGLHLRICVLAESAARAALPWFIKQVRFFEFTNDRDFESVLDEFVDGLGNLRLAEYESVRLARQQFLELYRIWKREAQDTAVRRWQLELASRVIENACSELASLNTRQFSSVVGGEHNFLMRAQPVFKMASSVYAVSLDTVSTFWVSDDRERQRFALEYWRVQPARTHRLFVCSTPENAHEYTTILNVHCKKYGAQGRVFLCSRDAYHHLLEGIGIATAEEDFAVLEYESPTGVAMFKATLDGERFTVVRQPGNGVLEQLTAFKQAITQLLYLQPGELDPNTGVMRWQRELQADKEAWAGKLKLLFGANKPDLFHIVFIAKSAVDEADVNGRLRVLMRELRALLTSIRQKGGKIQLKDFWVGDCCPLPAFDAGTNGRILNGDAEGFPRMLLMRFNDEDSLRHWYADPAHSTLRRRIYELIDPALPPLFASIDAKEGPSAQLYETIERLASEHLARRDYRESDTIDDIVCRKQFNPKVRFEL